MLHTESSSRKGDPHMSENTLQAILLENHISPDLIAQSEKALRQLELLEDMTDLAPVNRGMTNQLFQFFHNGSKYLLRIAGPGTSKIIDRYQEADVYRAISGKGLTEDVLFIQPETGIKISRFLEGTTPCDPQNPEHVLRCMHMLRDFHSMDLAVDHPFDLYEKIALYESQCGIEFAHLDGFAETRQYVMDLKNLIAKYSKGYCLCHVDAVYDNFLLSKDRVYLIDWEYSGMCDRYIDVAMFCIYAWYDKTQTDAAIRAYLGDNYNARDCMMIYAYMSVSAYLWVLWCEIKRSSGVTYDEYELAQYRMAREFYHYAIDIYGQLDADPLSLSANGT